MRQIVMTKDGDGKVLKIEHAVDPEPGAGEVCIEVKAAGINFADILARKGLYPDAPKKPCVVGYEVSGIVESVGKGVSDTIVGKAVLALTRFHGYSEKVTVPQHNIFEKPETLSFEEAAAIPVNYITAWQLIVIMGSLQPQESILIHNAGGGVGLAALDIAKHIGAVTYGTASPTKHHFLKQRGLDHAVDYRQQNWKEELNKITHGSGVELILDPLGGNHWKKSYKALRSTGRLAMFGVSAAARSGWGEKLGLVKMVLQMPWFNPVALMNANKSVYGVNLGHMWHESQKIISWMQTILKGVDDGWVKPHVCKTFPFDDVADAHAYIESRQNIGKVVLVP